MPAVLGLLFLVLPLLEIVVLIQVGDWIGIFPTILLLVLISILGAVMAKREGVAVWRRFREALNRGEIPSAEVADGFLVLLGAALLLTPGFITDAFGFLLLLPPTRASVKRSIRRGGRFLFFWKFPKVSAANEMYGRYRKVRPVRVESDQARIPTPPEAPPPPPS